MLSTIFEHQVYLGFLSQQPIEEKTFEKTFLGGRPIFLRRPDSSLLECTVCNKQKLTFVCQIFCPLDAPQSYNRVLYVFYCEKCERVFRCLKQQSNQNQQIEHIQTSVRVISQTSYEIQSNGFEVKELLKIMKRAEIEVEDEVIEQKEQEGDEDEQEEQIDLQEIQKMGFTQYQPNQLNKQEIQSLKYASQVKEQSKQQKDITFQQYKKIMNQIDSPVLLYSNIPIPYNNLSINPKHFCKFCKTKLTLQLQLTQRLLSLNQKLLRLDWGSLMVFTCANSCNQSIEECIVVQYEVDAIQDSQVQTLRKRQKNKKRKQQKEKSKSRQREHRSKSKGVQQQKKQKAQDNDQGDWD